MHQWESLFQLREWKISRNTKNNNNFSRKNKDMSIKEVIKSMTSDRIEWQKRMHVANYKNLVTKAYCENKNQSYIFTRQKNMQTKAH